MSWSRLDDALVGAAFAAVAALCIGFRYLPMTDLPQHYAMVSILVHHGDPAYGFADRFTFDFLGRPYASVYLFAAGLAEILPLAAAMRFVVAVCTLAPLAGTYALLRATDRPRLYALLAVPFAFGALWHWGFLNFLAGTGLSLCTLALIVRAARRPSRRLAAIIAMVALVLLFTHVHGLLMLLGLAPIFAWGFRDDRTTALGSLRACLPLAPATLLAACFAMTTWRRAQGSWDYRNPGFAERIERLPTFLGAGIRAPWPTVSLAVFAALVVGCFLVGRRGWPRQRQLVALLAALATQIVCYFALPLGTSNAAFLSARHALLCVLFALPLGPVLAPGRLAFARGAAAAFAVASLLVAGLHLASFDREAREFDAVLERMKPNRRVVSQIFDSRSPTTTHPFVMPYQHFAAYYQAAGGGDLSFSFARIWNIPIRYRLEYPRYVIDERIEFRPRMFSLDADLPHYDYVLVRSADGASMPWYPPRYGVELVVTQGRWSLWENPRATTP